MGPLPQSACVMLRAWLILGKVATVAYTKTTTSMHKHYEFSIFMTVNHPHKA